MNARLRDPRQIYEYGNETSPVVKARLRYAQTDPRRRFAWRANRKAIAYGRSEDILIWTELPPGPWSCAYCGAACESWDHVVPLSRGGLNQASNLVPSCVACNQRRNPGARVNVNGSKSHCKSGHPYDSSNTAIGTKGERKCRACDRLAHSQPGYRRRAA